MTNNRELILKWTKYLLYLQIAGVATSLLLNIPIIGSIVSVVGKIVSLGIVVVLFNMSSINNRYRKAAIFLAISIVAAFLNMGLLTTIGSIFSLVAIYQEYIGHAELVAELDKTLSGKWHSLFNWQIFSGLILGMLGAPLIAVVGVATQMDTPVITNISLALILGVDIIIRIFYLMYLSRMRKLFENS